ncbi:MAG: DsrE family protein [Gammaproteobacteria bacterium]|nr:DsrE family protein [Gammaproteobacteria bacterium]
MRKHAIALAMLTFVTLLGAIPAAQAAVTKVVLQISNAKPATQTLVLNVANNLINAYGLDNVKIHVVAFGPGLKLLFAKNPNLIRIQSLSASGVHFDACENTLAAMTKQLGYRPKLDPYATPVPAGIVQIVKLVHRGYTLVKP